MLGSTIETLDAECTIIDVLHAEWTSEYKNQYKMLDSDDFSKECKRSNDDIDDRSTFDMFNV